MNNQQLTVCHLANFTHPFYGNFFASLFNLEKHLNENNHKQIYVFYENSKDCYWYKEMLENGKSIFLVKYRKIATLTKLLKIIKKNNVDILHLHFTFPVLLCLFIKLLYPKIKIIAHLHNLLSGVYGPKIYSKKPIAILKKIFYNTFIFDLFCCISGQVMNDMIECGIKKTKCYHIDNCIDFSRLDKYQITKYDEYKNKNVLMIIGTYFKTKGVDIAIAAIKDIIDKYNIILMIVCQNKEFVERQITKQLGFIPPWISIKPSKENITEYFKNSSLFLVPSREEGFSYAMLESIYCGTPVIRSDIPAMDRGLPHDMVVKKESHSSLREKIEYALNLPEPLRKSNAAEQKLYITKRWNIDNWSKNVLVMYDKILNKKKKKIIIVSLNGDDNSGGVERVTLYLKNILCGNYNIKILRRYIKLGIFDKLFYPVLFSFILIFYKKNIIISNSWQSYLYPADFSIHHGTTAGYMLNTGIISKKSSVLAWMEKISAQKAKKVIAVSENCKQVLIDLYGIPENKIIVLNNFVDEKLFYPLDFRNKNNGKIIILFSGRLEERKGLSALLELAKYIEADGKYLLKIAANSSYNTGLFSGLKNTIILSNLDIKSMREFYNSGDVFYFPTKYEGFSMATLEALACGIPVIGTSFAVPEEIKHYDFVQVIEKYNNVSDVLKYIGDLCEKQGNNRKNIHAAIIKDFGYEKYKNKLLAIIK